ncbi:hypothetical protein OG874_03065 [Nocardia sp. NBC_00565]|uniref:hypothetical protein n=1 Tax=Nocardia sp. NBC_00565 TaxID=2975993 RepID=UPI002E81E345|nr:hypothetical protein [Nocardia sp. NBC_00565]WUC04206.1 hypothetical protein OG874_03065 [Nocardia sp. NBC_00565]
MESLLQRVESHAATGAAQGGGHATAALFRKYWPAAINGDDLKAAELVLRIHDRRAKLHGLPMPERLILAQLPGMSDETFMPRVAEDLAALGITAAMLEPPLEKDTEPWADV